MHGTNGMLKSGMKGSGIYITRHAQLSDASQALKPMMFYKVKNIFIPEGDESMNRIIQNLPFVHATAFGGSARSRAMRIDVSVRTIFAFPFLSIS